MGIPKNKNTYSLKQGMGILEKQEHIYRDKRK